MADAARVERLVGEETLSDIRVRYFESEFEGKVHVYAAGSPLTDEWCYLADSPSLDELEAAVEIVLGNEDSRKVFIRMAALLGVPWSEGEMLPLLAEQEAGARRLFETAPDTAERDPEELRRIRREAAEDVADRDA